MSRFASALTSWFSRPTSPKPRTLADETSINSSLVYQYRDGKRPISIDALSKLLPAIERHSSRTEALSLHVAYLLDEIVSGYEADLHVSAVDATTKAPTADTIAQRSHRWAQRARTDAEFEAMWAGLDGYITGADSLTQALPPDPTAPTCECAGNVKIQPTANQ